MAKKRELDVNACPFPPSVELPRKSSPSLIKASILSYPRFVTSALTAVRVHRLLALVLVLTFFAVIVGGDIYITLGVEAQNTAFANFCADLDAQPAILKPPAGQPIYNPPATKPAFINSTVALIEVETASEFIALVEQNPDTPVYFYESDVYSVPNNLTGYFFHPEWHISDYWPITLELSNP